MYPRNEIPFRHTHPGVVGALEGVEEEVRGYRVQKLVYRFDAGAVLKAYRAALEAGKREFALPVTPVQPKPSVQDFWQRGIRELVGEATTHFTGSPPSRIHNIRLASSRLDGVQVSPGAVFSFNRTLGPVTEAMGYQKAWVIRGNQAVWDVGVGSASEGALVWVYRQDRLESRYKAWGAVYRVGPPR